MKVTAKRKNGYIHVEGLTKSGAQLVRQMLYGIVKELDKAGSISIDALGVKDKYRKNFKGV